MNKVLFWDFDGTLVHSNSLWSGSIYKALKETVVDSKVTLEMIEPYTSTGFTWYTPENDYLKFVGEYWWDYMNEYFKNIYVSLGFAEEIADVMSKKVREFIKEKENYILYEDTISVLEKVNSLNCKNIILSNNYPDLYDVLEKLQLAHYFDDFVISANVGYDKPRKEIFEYAKGLYPNAEYYMIGDSIKADITGGKNAGMTTILVHKPFNEIADYCFDTLMPICKLLSDSEVKIKR